MVRNNFIYIFFALFLLFPIKLSAQINSQPGYSIDYSNEKPRITQKIVWDSEEHAMQYDVEIRIFFEEGAIELQGLPSGYYIYIKEITVNNFIDVKLPPGIFQYCITPYDYLGRKGEPSEWENFEVIAAFLPVIDRFFPETFFLDQRKERELNLFGSNFLSDSQIYLRSPLLDLHAFQISVFYENSAALLFDDDKLMPGEYQIYVLNPGGFEYITDGFTIEYNRLFDYYFKVGYTPISPIYGVFYDLFGSALYLTGVTFSFEAINTKRNFFNTGFEINCCLFFLNPDYSLSLNQNLDNSADFNSVTTISINIPIQRKFNQRKMAVSLRIGGGISIISGVEEYDAFPFLFHMNLGLSYIMLLSMPLHLEISAEFDHHIINNPSGILKPRLALVWQF